MAKKDYMVRMRNIRKSYGENTVLKYIDLDVKKGEVLAIIGPSGSGKSTLLRCLNHLESIDSGTIEVVGETFATDDGYGSTSNAVNIPAGMASCRKL